LLIYTPASAKGSNVKSRYPVMYVLDGPSFFEAYTAMVRYLSDCGKIPQMIVVGIANTDRVRDYTPTHAIHWSDGEKDEKALKTSGGGETFTTFLEKELIPHIDSLYPTAPYRVVVGHSLGGLLVLNTLIHRPYLFNAYVTIDPSLWWDQRALLKKASTVLAQTDYAGKKIFFASANTLANGMDTLRIEQDTAKSSVHVRDNLLFRQILQKNKTNHLVSFWKYYPDDNHASVPFIAGYDAMRAVFKGYELPKELNDPSINAEFIGQHYHTVSDMLGYAVLPPESMVNILGYESLSSKRYDQAYHFFTLNVANYPQSFNVYDSLGDYYLEVGDNKQAASAFRKALRLQDQAGTRKKLEALSKAINPSK
jgi:predicted alpha/beta superfamily hydrolase